MCVPFLSLTGLFSVFGFSDRGQGRDYYTFAFDDPEEFFEEDSLPG